MQDSRQDNRIVVLDVLRGFALFGILQVNIEWQANGLCLRRGLGGPLDQAAEFLRLAVFGGKLYILFAFLFGYGAYLMLASGTAGARSRYDRRMLALVGFGLLHYLLASPLDILTLYGIAGLLLAGRTGWTEERLLGSMWRMLALAAALGAIGLTVAALDTRFPEATRGCLAVDRAMRGESFTGLLAARHPGQAGEFIAAVLVQSPMVAACFMAGMVAARRRVFRDSGALAGLPVSRILALAMLCLVAGGVVALAVQGFLRLPGPLVFALASLATLLSPALSIVLAMPVVTLWRRVPGGFVTRLLAQAGQASLSHYLLQSAVTLLIFAGFGLGLYQRTGAAATFVLAIAVPVLIIGLLSVWPRRLGAGPAEWALARVIGPKSLPPGDGRG